MSFEDHEDIFELEPPEMIRKDAFPGVNHEFGVPPDLLPRHVGMLGEQLIHELACNTIISSGEGREGSSG